MEIKPRYIVIGFVLVTLGHTLAVKVGLYQGKVWVDMPLHLISGILLGTVGIWLAQKSHASPLWFWALSIALLGSFAWEVFEFLVLALFPEIAFSYRLYSLTVSDLLSDIFLGLAGGFLTAILFKIFSKT